MSNLLVRCMRTMRQSLLLCSLLVLTTLMPLVAPVGADAGEDAVVCCDASPVELYLSGSDSNKKLTPFLSELSEEAQSVSLETSISSQESIGRWVLPIHGEVSSLPQPGPSASTTK